MRAIVLAQGAPAMVPFWVQVLSIGLAPLIGFVGVTVGATLKDKSDRRIALRKERRELYAKFLNTLYKLNMTFGTTCMTALRSNKEETVNSAIAELKDISIELGSIAAEIDLIGSSDTAKTVYEYAVIYGRMNVQILMDLGSGNIKRSDWGRILTASYSFAFKFRDSALADLDIPKSQRQRLDIKPSTDEDEDELAEKIQSMIAATLQVRDRKRSRNSQAGDPS
jgi:hypothetical protein